VGLGIRDPGGETRGWVGAGRAWLGVALTLAYLAWGAGGAGAGGGDGVDFRAEVVAPGAATPFVHAPTIAVLPSGELVVAWYGARHHRGRDAAIYGARSRDGGRRWSPPIAWADSLGLPDANPAIFRDPQDRLWLFYGTRLVGWAVAWVRYRRSDDGGHTWDSPRLLTWMPGYLPRAKPIVLADSAWLLPVYHEEWGSRFLRSADGGASWTWSDRVVSDPLNIQPAAVELAPGRLLALMRNRGAQGLAWAARSADGGRTWEAPTLTHLRNPDAGLDLVRLRGGALAVAYNDSASRRHALAVALSEDDGRSWPAQVLLEGCGVGPTASYPAMAEGPDGALHVVYASDNQAIRYARLDPRRIAGAGRPPARCEPPAAASR